MLLVAQGVFGNMPWVALSSFGVLWLQYVGLSNAEVAAVFFFRGLAGGLGACFGGWLSDRLAACWPANRGFHARIAVAQLSVAPYEGGEVIKPYPVLFYIDNPYRLRNLCSRVTPPPSSI